MKKLLFIGFIFILIISCSASKSHTFQDKKGVAAANDTIRIANDKLEYEVIIIDAGFSSWMASYAKPRNYYSQQYMETRNRIWVNEWNLRARQPGFYNSSLYEMEIDYQNGIDYGYEVNYMLYNYLTYFQITNNIKLGGFVPRI